MATNDRKSARLSIVLRTLSTKSSLVELAESLLERVSVLERALREIMVEVERFEDSEVVVILSPEVRQLAAETERNTL